MSLIINHNNRVENSKRILTSDPRAPPGLGQLFLVRNGRYCYVAIRRVSAIFSKLTALPVEEVNIGVIIGTLRKNGKRHFILPLHPDCNISQYYFVDLTYFTSSIPADELEMIKRCGYEVCHKYAYSKLLHRYIPLDE